MLADLAGGHADRTIGQRMREYTRPLVLIVDDFAIQQTFDATSPQSTVVLSLRERIVTS